VVDKAKDRAEQIESAFQQSIVQKTTSPDETSVKPVSQLSVSTISTAAALDKPVTRRKVRSR
jgi:hypothetical protein